MLELGDNLGPVIPIEKDRVQVLRHLLTRVASEKNTQLGSRRDMYRHLSSVDLAAMPFEDRKYDAFTVIGMG